MQASFTRSLGVVGLMAVSLTGCQSASLGKFSWNPTKWKFGRKADTALAANAANSTEAAPPPWTPTLPSQGANPGYTGAVAGNTYPQQNAASYNTGYAAVPTGYANDPSQNPWGVTPAAGAATPAPSYDQNAYATAPAMPQAGPYDAYGQPTGGTAPYTQAPQSYGAAPMTNATPSYDPASQQQYGPAPGYPQQQQQYGQPAAQMADNTRYPQSTQYDGTQQSYGAQPGYTTPAATTGYETTTPPATQQYEAWPPATQNTAPATTPGYPQQTTAPATGATTQPYRPGGTGDYAPTPGYDGTQAAPSYPQ